MNASVTCSIDYKLSRSNTQSSTENDLISNVFIDTISPRINLDQEMLDHDCNL